MRRAVGRRAILVRAMPPAKAHTSGFQGSDQVSDPAHAVCDAPAAELVDDLLGRDWIEVICCSDFYRRRAREYELDDVGCAGYAAHADHRDVDRMGCLVYHAQRYGLDGGAAQPGGHVRDAG